MAVHSHDIFHGSFVAPSFHFFLKKTVFVCKEKEISEGQSKKVSFKLKGRTVDAFVVRYRGKLCAYWNRCSHMPLPLDWGDNDFFSPDKKYLICKNHGAVYAPDSGECVAGPCTGHSLESIGCAVDGRKVYLKLTD